MIWPKEATCSHLRPLAWNCLERPLAATRFEFSRAATCGHLRPLAATRVAASGCHALALETLCSQRPLAATQVAASGCEWAQGLLQQVEAIGRVWSGRLRPLARNWLERPLAWNCLERPLAATRVVASGCNHALASEASCSHLLQRPLAANQAAASGCKRRRVAACW